MSSTLDAATLRLQCCQILLCAAASLMSSLSPDSKAIESSLLLSTSLKKNLVKINNQH